MEANFFKQIAQMDIDSRMMLTISKATDSIIIVSVFIQNDGCGDKAKNIIPPFNLKGTPHELDAEFFGHIKKPIQAASGLISNMESFMKQLEEAQKQSAMEKEKTDNEKKECEEKDKKYKAAMLKADGLEKESKYREAWTALPKAADHPEHAETIRKRQTDFAMKFQPEFFDQE
ncbi:PRTRC system protein E [Chryseobacterium populi]|uniref:PRTRC system protein E n=1 Tax=Chryseobacterium populi TaxID=1144316 RepID=J2K2M3_9FLAO|nr:PRTRC system protein E [Chryseobacterium populi]EJL74405.1 PRTRC system protein E [Chryseobacterium populi]